MAPRKALMGEATERLCIAINRRWRPYWTFLLRTIIFNRVFATSLYFCQPAKHGSFSVKTDVPQEAVSFASWQNKWLIGRYYWICGKNVVVSLTHFSDESALLFPYFLSEWNARSNQIMGVPQRVAIRLVCIGIVFICRTPLLKIYPQRTQTCGKFLTDHWRIYKECFAQFATCDAQRK